MPLLWMSFVDPELPEGSAFLGVAIVEAKDIGEGTALCWDLGINPGGEVLAGEMPEPWPPCRFRDRLLQKPEIEELRQIMA
jgi:hypothetical protein